MTQATAIIGVAAAVALDVLTGAVAVSPRHGAHLLS